ncbi:DUF2231 domain-containing protein [Nocardia seriolae]|uniref:DUF2231 domain-containing protein n=1 Tax=Nocardia seriolae TaxID=37332 RepID=A0ABC9YWQ7_9NOCA|nr:DUF2231 domain-containing protein [Nocardia seriolae]BEK94637.1 hypothetical protein NSER024013_25430 [Nocardia seriolae]GAM47953.1 hypothetical protein NS07_v2contig00061-0041 [Nocardia seriolae]GAP29817.1 hypothetical protein NSK11_contig00064-0041 [Nocardia seriolae]
MSTINGLPAHVLLVHVIVVLVPLTAGLVILCALWPAARTRLIWPTAALAVTVTALTPVTVKAGEWFQRQLGMPPVADEHARLGQQMLYFVAPLLLSAELLVFAHVRQGRGKPAGRAVVAVIALVAIAAGGAAAWQTYRVGDSGAHAVWNGVVGH